MAGQTRKWVNSSVLKGTGYSMTGLADDHKKENV